MSKNTIKLSDYEMKIILDALYYYLEKHKAETITDYIQREKVDKLKTIFERLGE